MILLQWTAVVLVLCTPGIMARITVCPVNKLQFLSYNATLLPRLNVQATSEDSSTNPLEYFVTKNSQPWCSKINDVNNPNLHVTLTFTESVVISFLHSSGYYNAFVNSFSIQYALGDEGDFFMPYGVFQVPQVFNVNQQDNIYEAYFSLERPLVAQRLQLNIHNSIFESSNRSCWSLKLLGCTFSEAMSISESVVEPDIQPCLQPTNSGMVMVNTPYPEPTELPSEPCTEPASPKTDAALSTQQMLTIVAPVAVFAVLLCAVIVGVGILCCYFIMARKSPPTSSKYHGGVQVKVLGHRNVPVPTEQGNEQKAFVFNGTMSSKKDSVCSDSDSFHYDMPRSIMYDVPRTPPQAQRQRTGTISSNEYRNPIYDGAGSNKDSNTYESIPFDLERMGQRTQPSSKNLPKSEMRSRRASDMLPQTQSREGAEQAGSVSVPEAMHSSDPQMTQYSVVDKSKKSDKSGKSKETVPVFEVLYDQSSKDDIDIPVIP